MRGLQGSGKSTWAANFVSEDPNHRIRVNRDDIRTMFGKYWLEDKSLNNAREFIISEAINSAISAAMYKGFNIVVDNMNLSTASVDTIYTLVHRHNHAPETERGFNDYYDIEIKDFFDIPLEECIKRDASRERSVGEEVIRATYERYKNTIEKENYG